jgi:hypothetical protein
MYLHFALCVRSVPLYLNNLLRVVALRDVDASAVRFCART